MATLTVPSQESLSASASLGRPVIHRPLSTHGRPKPPRAISPPLPQHFSALGFASKDSPSTPRSPAPRSPPMSAKSFGTFIDSEPSTPAYSPRLEQGWESSAVVLMRPMSSSSEPSTPAEPSWEMMAPTKVPPQYPTSIPHAKSSKNGPKGIPPAPSPLPRLVPRQPQEMKRPGNIHVVNLNQRDDESPVVTNIEQDKPKSRETGSLSPGNASFGKLASKMKLMLRNKNTNEKKEKNEKKNKKKKEWEDVDRLEDIHWTEM